MASDKKASFHKYQDDDLNEAMPASSAAHINNAPIREEVREQQAIEAHLGGGVGPGRERIHNEETHTLALTDFLSLEDLERGKVKIEIGDLQASLFRRTIFHEGTNKTTHAGDVNRAQITRVVLFGYSSEFPVDVAIVFSSTTGELTSEAVKSVGARNGRKYPLIVKRESAANFGQKKALLIYSNDQLIDNNFLEKYGSLKVENLRAGLTPHPTNPAITLFDFKQNQLLYDLVRTYHERLEALYDDFNYQELRHEANILGRDTVHIPTVVVDHLVEGVTKHGIGAVEEGTGPLAKAAITLESPTAKDGAFSDARSILAAKTGLDAAGVDRLMHIKHQIDFSVTISAVIPGAGAP